MAYFFFHHPLVARPPVPGRYPMDCIGTLVDPGGAAHHDARFAVPGDGLAPNMPGANVDPCPFATPLAIAHTFCRLDKRGGKFYVSPGFNLAQSVRPGDAIFYGHLRTSRGHPSELYIDTVLVVERTPGLPTERPGTSGKAYHFDTGPAFAAVVLGSEPSSASAEEWTRLRESDLWEMNLKDVRHGGDHEFTAFQPHRIIVGTVAPTGEEGPALAERSTSYVPLVTSVQADRGAGGAIGSPPMLTMENAQENLWPDLDKWVEANPRLAGGNKPPRQMDTALGEAIYDQVRALSGSGGPFPGHVAMPPLRWYGGNAASLPGLGAP